MANVKKYVLYCLGALVGRVQIIGCYPLGLVYFMATGREPVNRLLMYAAVLGGMLCSLPLLESLKYAIVMAVSGCLAKLLEKIAGKCSSIRSAAVAGGCLALVTISGSLFYRIEAISLLRGLLEGTFVFALIMLSDKLPGCSAKARKLLFRPPYAPDGVNRNQLRDWADSFQSLAKTFDAISGHKEKFTSEDMDTMFQELAGKLCADCGQCTVCWEINYYETCQNTYDLLESLDKNGQAGNDGLQGALAGTCIRYQEYLEEAVKIFERSRLNLSWYNRLIENRQAIAQQLSATAAIIGDCAGQRRDVTGEEWELAERIRQKLSQKGLRVKHVAITEQKGGFREFSITMCTRWGKCVTVKEIAQAVSAACRKRVLPSRQGRAVVGRETVTVLFLEDTLFHVLSGVAKMTKEGEAVSGDNFALTSLESGQFVMSLSDGMGSGIRACRESETVIELIEKFLEAGFEKETAIRMINSAMVLRDGNELFSTVDIAALDLHTGMCDFLKIGASSTFIKREGWVEAIRSTSLPVGMFYDMEIDRATKKLYSGDFVIMVSDGVMDSLPEGQQELMLKEIISGVASNNPTEIAKKIIQRVLPHAGHQARDDLTVLVCGIWEK